MFADNGHEPVVVQDEFRVRFPGKVFFLVQQPLYHPVQSVLREIDDHSSTSIPTMKMDEGLSSFDSKQRVSCTQILVIFF